MHCLWKLQLRSQSAPPARSPIALHWRSVLQTSALTALALAVACSDSARVEVDAAVEMDAAVEDSGKDSSMDSGADGAAASCPAEPLPALIGETVTGGLTMPVFVTQAPGTEDGTLWILEKGGRILLHRDGALLPTPFLDLRSKLGEVTLNDERGLLGLAFHPQYQTNRRFFIYYAPASGDETNFNIVAEYLRSEPDPDVADSDEFARLFAEQSPFSNHNGGMLAFRPSDGMLYVGIGDGGGANDLRQTALDLGSPFGKLLRFDPDVAGYLPEDNPFRDRGRADVWAYGLRNPWRFSFDRANDDLWIGDVGQDTAEEINHLPASAGGANFGWSCFEGEAPFAATAYTPSECTALTADHVPPVYSFGHGQFPGAALVTGACSVTGGYVYRGSAIKALRGYYVFTDYCSEVIAAVKPCEEGGGLEEQALNIDLPASRLITSFGEDLDGALYIVRQDSENDADGAIYRITLAEP
ncbi:MAG: PQQ-dependent sugar dehydrogenase [Myxococcota bacterium]